MLHSSFEWRVVIAGEVEDASALHSVVLFVLH